MMNLILIHLLPFFSKMSGKKLAALAIVIIIGAIFGVQALFGFPLKDLIRKEVTDEAKVVIKDDHGTCIVKASDRQPRSIPNCPYKVSDTLVVTGLKRELHLMI